ncbi:MAG: Rne/Rng family ribonuclease [Acidobacteriaceae bacterium]
MSKEIYISSTPHETRLAIVEDEALTEIYYERENEYTLAGSIYNGRVTRVLPGMQSSFVDIGLERDAFLYITDFMEEAPDSEEFDTTPASDRPRTINAERSDNGAARTESGGRGQDRGGRGRRGGRDRDRDRNPDRQAGPDAAARAEQEPADAAPAPPRELDDAAEIGEGAPGAEANRRWRGRRGRRRGRGLPGQSGDPAQQNAPASPEDESSTEPETYPEIEAFESANAPTNRDDSRSQRRDGQRFDAPRRDSFQRPDQRPQRPRGFAPSRDRYGMDTGEAGGTGPVFNAYPDADSGSSPEPLILPGESLSKYRKGEEPAASTSPTAAHTSVPPTTVTLAPPANLYTVAAGWDGGDVLPGETLSRRRPSDSRPESRTESPRSFDRGPRREDRPGRNDRFGRGEARRDSEPRRDNRSDSRNAAPAPALVTTGVEPPPVPPVQQAVQNRNESAPVLATPAWEDAPATTPEAPTPTPPVEAEYEPDVASASYRVDPLPRTEFRQGAPVLEPPVEAVAETPAQIAEASAAVAPPADEPAAEVHDITSITSTGDMLSEPVEVLPEATPHPTPIEVPEPASPIRHEGAVLSAGADADFAVPPVTNFAPGSGQLHEEILEEEEVDGSAFHASSIEEIDDLEEETLEGAADLGTMLRDMSIDHITRTPPELEAEDDEEDDLEEDDLEEDDEEEGESADEIDDRAGADQAESEDADDDLHEQAAQAARFEQDFNEPGDAMQFDQPGERQSAGEPSPARDADRDLGRDSERRGGRRDGRRGQRGDRDRGRGGRSGFGGSRNRMSMQSTNLPVISDLLKPGQEILVQIAKEPIAKKGARITSHIALPGRFLVFMPTVNHTGVSRKIESDAERRRLKEILLSEKGDATGGFIVRTAAEGASEEELRSDLRFLLNLWADIKARSDSSKSPALIYHDLNLVERILRDQVTDTFSAIWVDTEDAYERVLRFLQRFQPSLIRRVKLYLKETPLFEQFGITEEINKALRSKVWLKSGGSIVINQTEALVAIDINTGKFVGKTARLEDTIVKTNLDAIPEIVRQIRLRDLGGIIIIDFIDMDERRNRNRVMAALEDELKSDRAPSKVLQFNDFGLVAITRKRVKQSLERTLSTTCSVCQGTGMVKSPVTVCNDIYIEMRKMHKHLDRGDVMLRVHPEVVKQLKSSGARWLQEMEEMVGKTILVKSDPALHPEQFDIH